jgi:predicted 3-demethylubiquinone-9 3-methyltransferase (glyoxalase superfamily)
MQKITPFLMFSQGAVEAMGFYASVFKDAKVVSTIPGPGGSPMGGTLDIGGQQILTFNGGPHFSFSSGNSLFVNAETQDEIDHLYDTLSEGGEKEPCGWLKDKFGVSWQIIPPVLGQLLGDPDREKANRVVQAMLKMHKIIIADLEAAAAG